LYQPRLYRGGMNRKRFRFFRSVHHESDLLIGMPHRHYHVEMETFAKQELIRLRQILLDYSELDPRFLLALEPLDLIDPQARGEFSGSSGREAAELLQTMIRCGHKTGTGPMSSVAGLFAERVGLGLVSRFGDMEVVVENGGDIFLRNESELVSVIHAGPSSLSDRMAFVIPAGEWGICTSSGTLGHSFSRGRADAVTVICASASAADAWATALANRVQEAADIAPTLELAGKNPEIRGCAVIVDEQVGVRGEFELKLLTSDR
jgi:ApbE superfamily uncharacterized protein (UPF0280 family)